MTEDRKDLFFFRYLPLFLHNKKKESLHAVMDFLAEAAKEWDLKAYEFVNSLSPLNPDYTYLYELWKKIDISEKPYLAMQSGLHLTSGGYCITPDEDVYLRTSRDFTIECWADVRYASGAGQYKTLIGFNYPAMDHGIVISGNYICGYMSGITEVVVGATTIPSGWHHYALTYRKLDNILSFYIDGTLCGYASVERNIYNYQNRLHISDPGQAYYISGIVDELRYYSVALEQSHIFEHANLMYENTAEDLYLYFNMNVLSSGQAGFYTLDSVRSRVLLCVNVQQVPTPEQSRDFYYSYMPDIYDVPELQFNLINNVLSFKKDDYYYFHEKLLIGLGASGNISSGTYFAPYVILRKDHFYRSWGRLVGLNYEPDSDRYLHKIRGLINVYFSPQNIMNFKRLVNIIAGAEVALDSGTVIAVSGNYVTIQYSDRTVDHIIPAGLSPVVSGGETVIPYQPLSDVCEVYDFVTDFYWMRNLQVYYIDKFVKDKTLPWNLIEDKIRYSMYLVEVKLDALVYYPVLRDIPYIESFLDRLNPPGKHYVYQIGEALKADIFMSGYAPGMSFTLDITPTLSYNLNLLSKQKYYDIINEGTIGFIYDLYVEYTSGITMVSGYIPYSGVYGEEYFVLK